MNCCQIYVLFVFLLLLMLLCYGFRLAVKKRGAAGGDRAGKKPAKKGKAEKDPNKPKRPASAFFVFMYELLT